MRWWSRGTHKDVEEDSLPAVTAEAPPPRGEPPADTGPEAAPAAVPPAVDAGQDGSVCIEGGRLRVVNPAGRGRWPVLVVEADAEVALWLNGERVSGDVVLRAEDDARLVPVLEEVPAWIDVEISDDRMRAWVTAHPPTRRRVEPRAVAAAQRVRLEVEATRDVGSLPFQAEDVATALVEAGVHRPVRPGAAQEALAQPEHRVLIAEGSPPVPGASGSVWTTIHGALREPPSPADPEAVDVWTSTGRPFIEIGCPVVQVRPGVAPAPGQAVTGEAIGTGPVPWAPVVQCGPGVRTSADGQTAIAAVSGHPEVVVDQEHVFVAVYPERQVAGDVDAACGDIFFDGDVWIEGDILPGRTVQASGCVRVRGAVQHARLEARGSVRVEGGAVNAVLVAGGPGLAYTVALPGTIDLRDLLSDLAAGTLPSRPGRMAAIASRLVQQLGRTEATLDPEVSDLVRLLGALARITENRLQPAQAGGAAMVVGAAVVSMRRALKRVGSCRADHLHNARVEATGNVLLGDQGSLRSSIVCGGQLRCDGSVRGGSVRAERGALLGVVGSEGEVETRIEIGADAVFHAREVHVGTVLVRGDEAREYGALTRDITDASA